MRGVRFYPALARLVALGTGVGCAAAVPAAPGMAACRPVQLQIARGEFVSPMTGEHAVSLLIVNSAAQPCRLFGWPHVRLFRGRRELPFVIRRGGGPYLGRSHPGAVVVRRGAPAHLVIAKYRCDGRVATTVTRVVLGLPRIRRRFSLALRTTGPPGLQLCRRGRGRTRADPGNEVAVTPVLAGTR